MAKPTTLDIYVRLDYGSKRNKKYFGSKNFYARRIFKFDEKYDRIKWRVKNILSQNFLKNFVEKIFFKKNLFSLNIFCPKNILLRKKNEFQKTFSIKILIQKKLRPKANFGLQQIFRPKKMFCLKICFGLKYFLTW